MDICMRCRRQRSIYSRGICNTCYQWCRRQNDEGTSSWAEMEAAGLCLGRGAQGRRTTNGPSLEEIKKAAAFGGLDLTSCLFECRTCEFKTAKLDEVTVHRREFNNHLLRMVKSGAVASDSKAVEVKQPRVKKADLELLSAIEDMKVLEAEENLRREIAEAEFNKLELKTEEK